MKLFLNLLFLLFSFAYTQQIYAQDIVVKSVNASKKLVTIKPGKVDGVIKGAKVCFYNDSTKVTCGKVLKVRKTSSLVKVKSSKIETVTTDSVAKFISKKRKRRKRKTRRRNNFRTNIKLAYSYMFLSPTSHNTPFYKHLTRSDGAGGAESNEPTGPNTSPFGMIRNRPKDPMGDSFLGGGLEFEFAFNKKMSVSLGGRYNHGGEKTERFSVAEGPSGTFNDSGYETSFPIDSYIDLTTNTAAFGGWLDFNFYGFRMGKSALLKFGLGVDAEFYSLSLSANSSLPPLPGKIKTADFANNGRLSAVISGRLPIDFSFNMKKFGVGIKVIPIFSFLAIDLNAGKKIINGPALDPTITNPLSDSSVRKQWEDALFEDDLEYGPAGFSLEIQPIYFAYYF